MSVAKFTLAIGHPTYPRNENVFPEKTTKTIRSKMDVASNPVLKSFLAGSFSGTCSTILFQPLDLVKTRLQQAGNTKTTTMPTVAGGNALILERPSMFSIVRHVLRTDSVPGLWRGITPSITRTVPGVGLYFGTLHWLKGNRAPDAGSPTALEAVSLGMGARCVAGAAMIPITVIKTRFESGAYDYAKMTQALTHIYRTEGARGLVCGLVPTLARDAPYSGLYLMFYTQLKQRVAPLQVSSEPTPVLHFACGIIAGFAASAVTHPADVVKTKMQLYPTEYGNVVKASLRVWAASGPAGFMVGLAPRMLRRTLMSALAWTVYEEIMRRAGLK